MALADYNEALRIDPEFPPALVNRGAIYFQRKDLQKALADFQKADSLRSDFNFALAGLAITHHALGDVTVAERYWQALVELDAGYMDADQVKEDLGWHDSLAAEARKVIARLGGGGPGPMPID